MATERIYSYPQARARGGFQRTNARSTVGLVQSQDFSASHVDRAVRVPLHKTERVTYQDGCPIQTEELTVLHATRASLLHAILKGGVASSIPSHGIEGLWSSARLQEAAFLWGSSIVEESAGIILEVRLPKFRLHRVSPSTPTDSERGSLADDKIRSSGAGGYFGWAVAGQSRREATRQSVFWLLCCSLENMSSTMDANPVPSGRQDKQARRMHDMRQCMATAYAQAAEILLRPDQSNSGFWESTGARLVKKKWHAGRKISRAPTNLCLLHVVQKGLSLCKDEDGVHGAFKDSEDLYLVSMSLSANITAILYPTQAYSGAGTKTIEYQKAGSISFNQVPIPLMAVLYKHFRHSVSALFGHASFGDGRKTYTYTSTSAVHRAVFLAEDLRPKTKDTASQPASCQYHRRGTIGVVIFPGRSG